MTNTPTPAPKPLPRDDKRAAALRANLRRRKQAPRETPAPSAEKDK
jgi:hypothetical protein